MSSPMQYDEDHNDPLYYAPRRVRDAEDGAGDALRRMPRAANLDVRPRSDGGAFEGDAVLKQMRLRGTLEPELVSAPPPAATSRFGLFARITAAVTIAAIAALLYAVLAPSQTNHTAATRGPNLASAHPETEAVAPASPRLVLKDARALGSESLPLGVGVSGATPGSAILISGLVTGTRITAGSPMGANGWRLSTRDLGDAALIPPRAYSGTMDLAVELRKADGAVADSGAVHMQWPATSDASAPREAPVQVASSQPQIELPMQQQPVQQAMRSPATSVLAPAAPSPPPAPAKPVAVQPPPQAPAQAAPSPPPAAPQPAATQPVAPQPAPQAEAAPSINADQAAFYLKMGEEFLSSGDLSGARPLLERAAEGRNARAAFELAATYDPIILGQLRARGVSPDVASARKWYEKAKALGSAEASSRLDQLANR